MRPLTQTSTGLWILRTGVAAPNPQPLSHDCTSHSISTGAISLGWLFIFVPAGGWDGLLPPPVTQKAPENGWMVVQLGSGQEKASKKSFLAHATTLLPVKPVKG